MFDQHPVATALSRAPRLRFSEHEIFSKILELQAISEKDQPSRLRDGALLALSWVLGEPGAYQ
jgi:hypothetical protein